MDSAKFAQDKHERGIMFALKESVPGFHSEILRKQRRLEDLEQMRLKYINLIAQVFVLGFSDAERLADTSGYLDLERDLERLSEE